MTSKTRKTRQSKLPANQNGKPVPKLGELLPYVYRPNGSKTFKATFLVGTETGAKWVQIDAACEVCQYDADEVFKMADAMEAELLDKQEEFDDDAKAQREAEREADRKAKRKAARKAVDDDDYDDDDEEEEERPRRSRRGAKGRAR